MKKFTAISLLLCFSTFLMRAEGELQKYSHADIRMGSAFIITALHKDINAAKAAVNTAYDEVTRIEKLISSWDENSQTSEVNRNAGIRPVKVDKELFDLIYRSKKVSELTGGIFDISYASADRIWKFDGSMKALPSDEDIKKSVEKINFRNIILNSDSMTVFLKEAGMKIGFGGIGKGYAANRCKQLMQDMGIENGVVNASGDLITWGHMDDGSDWTIGIADPDQKNSAISWMKISNMAVVTSGNYEHFVEFNGKRYCHIINPKTGWPAEMLSSVTIFCPDAEIADALATSVFIMGPEDGVEFVNRVLGVECLIIDEAGKIYTSENISLNYYGE